MIKEYKKNTDAILDEEFKNAEPFGNIRLGKNHIFAKKIIRWSYVSLSDVGRAWRRIEEVKGRTGCCSNDFSRHFLMLLMNSGETLKLKIGEEMYRHEPEALMEKLKADNPDLPIGMQA